MPMKLPFMKFYPGDWVQDTRCLTLSTKGFWIDVICHLWRCPSRGKDTMPMDGWCKMTSSTPPEVAGCLEELQRYHIADCTCDDAQKITVECRRMLRYDKSMSKGYLRLKKFRETHHDNANDNPIDNGTEARCQKLDARKRRRVSPDGDTSLNTSTSKQPMPSPPNDAPPPVVAGDQPSQESPRRPDLAGGTPDGAGQGGDRQALPKRGPAAGTAKAPSWVQKAVETWAATYGNVGYGMMGKLLKPCVTQHGEAAVLAALDKYCHDETVRRFFPSPAKFATNIKQFLAVEATATGSKVVFLAADKQW